jgi:hypothetical protein
MLSLPMINVPRVHAKGRGRSESCVPHLTTGWQLVSRNRRLSGVTDDKKKSPPRPLKRDLRRFGGD